MAENERTLKMKSEYVRLHFDEKKSPKEIAQIFGLNVTTVYKALYEIARETGISRSDLLDQPHEKPVSYDRRFEPVEPFNSRPSMEFYEKTIGLIDDQLKEVRSVINALEKEDLK